jgi:hypothetical protein
MLLTLSFSGGGCSEAMRVRLNRVRLAGWTRVAPGSASRIAHRRPYSAVFEFAGGDGAACSYASTLAGAGFSLPIIGALLGHTQPSTTQRYAHLADNSLRVATERAGAILSGQPSAEIVPLPDRHRG